MAHSSLRLVFCWITGKSQQDVGTSVLRFHLKCLSLATSTFNKSQGLQPLELPEPAQSFPELSSTGSTHRQCRPRCWWQGSESIRYTAETLPRASPAWSRDMAVQISVPQKPLTMCGKATNSFTISSQSQTSQFCSRQEQNPATVAKT